jgi:hypothetical protein
VDAEPVDSLSSLQAASISARPLPVTRGAFFTLNYPSFDMIWNKPHHGR